MGANATSRSAGRKGLRLGRLFSRRTLASAGQPGSPGTQARAALSRPRLRLYRGLALLLVPVLVAAIEGICRLGGWGASVPLPPVDPGLAGTEPLFELDDLGRRFVTRESRLRFFVPDSFPAIKEATAFRIFCLGGSTVQGRPYGKETAFSTWLRLGLEAAEPARRWEVVNCGGVSYASYRLTPILRECLAYQPDLIILCTGHNEFLEARTFPRLKGAPSILVRAHETLLRLHSVRLLLGGLRRRTAPGQVDLPARRPRLGAEVDALLDYRDGLRAYHRDPAWREGVIREYASNLRAMLNLARQAKVPVLLIRPPSDLRDCPPFKSEHRPGMRADELGAWTALVEEARLHYQGELGKAIELLEQAIKLDNQHAGTFYALGKCYEGLARAGPARKAFWQARELDVCPLRMLAAMEEILVRAAEETTTPLLDAHALLERQSSWEILGNDWLVDHIHPSIRGHQLIAEAILEEMTRQGWVQPAPGWEAARQLAYERHLASLDQFYFLEARRRLENLRAWTQGRADGPPIGERVIGDR